MRIADVNFLHDYSYWATNRILRTAASISDEQFAMPTRFPHGSLRGTLVHMLYAERFWLYFWQEKPRRPRLTDEEFPDVATLSRRWDEDEAEMRTYLATLVDDDLDRPIPHITPGRFNYTAPLWTFLMHPITHGTLHRSEAAQILTEFGHSPGDHDIPNFLNGRGA